MAKRARTATALKLAPVVQLRPTPPTIHQDCVDDLLDLLIKAKSGELIGVAYAAMHKGRDYIVNTAGEARKSPTFARGMVRALDEHLSELVHK